MSVRNDGLHELVASLLLLMASGSASSQLTQIAKLHASDAAAGDGFASSVAVSGSVAFVGAPGDDDMAAEAGAVYVFENIGGTWTQVQKLTVSNHSLNEAFGFAVARAGSVGLATAGVYSSATIGKIYVFSKVAGNWTEKQVLTPSDGALGIDFGFRVAIADDLIVTGAERDQPSGFNSGSAYVFQRLGDTWTPAAKLTASDGGPFDSFGIAVAVAGGDVFVGAPWDDDGPDNAGSVSVFRAVDGVWTRVDKLLAADAEGGDKFGFTLAASGNILVAGAPSDGPESGSAYVFEKQSGHWTQVAKLTASDGQPNELFSLELAVSGDIALISSLADGGGGIHSGSAYAFQRLAGGWTQVAKLSASDGGTSDEFGLSLSLAGDRAFVGASPDDGLGQFAGAAYVFDLDLLPTFVDLGYALAGVNGDPTLAATGTLVAGTPVSFLLTNARPSASSSFIAGWTALNAPFKGGTLVPFPVFLIPVSTSALGAAAIAGHWPAGIPTDTLTYFQWWIVDPAGPAGLAASNALQGRAQ